MASTTRAVHMKDQPLALIGALRRQPDGVRVAATTDHDEITAWAVRHGAEPATGEATASGPATIAVNDGGAGIRFNFPGFARLRPISWDEWFDNFERHDLVFVYEAQDWHEVAVRAHALWQRRGGDNGHDRDDWFQAEHELRRDAHGEDVSLRYWIVSNRSTSPGRATSIHGDDV
jgi:DUF2934 family protein